MSVQIHCDNCDDSLLKVVQDRPLTGRVEHVVIVEGNAGDYFGGFPDARRDFCDYACMSRWARDKAKDEAR